MSPAEKKKLKNKRYYEKHKARILEKNRRSKGVATTQSKRSIVEHPRASESALKLAATPKKPKISSEFHFERIFIVGLVVLTTLFLIRETASYLTQAEGGAGLIKALISEGMIMALSWLNFPSFRLRIVRLALLSALFALNLWAISGNAVSANDARLKRAELTVLQIRELESTIQTKESLRIEARIQDRQTLARRYEREIDSLRSELNSVRSERLKVQSPSLTKIQTIQSILFRLVVMAANALLVSQLAGLKRRSPRRFSLDFLRPWV